MSGGWNTIESDAGVFTSLLSTLGIPDVQCEELISLDSDTLSTLSPLGVIFLFRYPTGDSSQLSGQRDGQLDHSASDPDANGNSPVWFARQSIQNACGTQALLSVVLNKSVTEGVQLGSTLGEFRDFTAGFDSELRGDALSNSTAIRDAHNSFARASPFISDEQKLATEDDDVFHFIGYTAVGGKLYELDGLQGAPISHGECKAEEFAQKVIPVLQRRIERYPAHEIRFNLLAVCKDLRIRARELGDSEWLYREEEKRRAWRWENALRKHNFVGFIGELAKGVVKQKVEKGEYDRWVEEAKGRTRSRREEARKKGRGGDEMDIE
ncbi:ubiquitinyl hydrolase [Myriangium duriaei CBS 260.36]|uniref:Ubiquitin carboxyl-terminal hydrolase n=1 Tax=Myriangium duriaei CBS 260.36 TaxID=1168546 RepID=A0A9P4J717_9PEZI|nr:ubiquitinyl hydrolase [Myriangium duriaei CBS 260.36]